jgi:DNA-binding XRE family transcriptional regulator
MAIKRWKDRMAQKYTPAQLAERRARAEAEIETVNLRALREAAGKTQAEVAKLVDIDQAEVSRLENRIDHRLSTLKRYVQALGGDIEVYAVIDGKRVQLQGV